MQASSPVRAMSSQLEMEGMEPESAESRGRDLMHGEWLCRQLRPMSSQDRAERTCEACQGRGRGGKFAYDGAEDDEDEDEVPKDEDEVPRVRMCESCQGRGRFACSSSEDEVPKDEDEVLGPDPNEVQNDEPMDTEIDDGSSDGFDFGVGAVMDDSKEGIINIERGEEDVSKRHATSDDRICAVPAGAVQATDGAARIYRCAIHEKRLNDLTMPQLRHLLDERGSTATGKWKEVLVDRCCDLGVTAAEIADAKKFKGKVRGLAVAAQDSKRARIAGPDADALAEAGALHRAGWKFSV